MKDLAQKGVFKAGESLEKGGKRTFEIEITRIL
jgi:hypothetical protein